MGLEDPLPIGNLKCSDSRSAFRKYSTPRGLEVASDPDVSSKVCRLPPTYHLSPMDFLGQIRIVCCLNPINFIQLPPFPEPFRARTGTQAPLQKARSRLDFLHPRYAQIIAFPDRSTGLPFKST